jgi:hypothetical protein
MKIYLNLYNDLETCDPRIARSWGCDIGKANPKDMERDDNVEIIYIVCACSDDLFGGSIPEGWFKI